MENEEFNLDAFFSFLDDKMDDFNQMLNKASYNECSRCDETNHIDFMKYGLCEHCNDDLNTII